MSSPDPTSDPRDYVLDLSTSATPAKPRDGIESNSTSPSEHSEPPAPYLSVHFKCCSIYAAIYRNREGTAYAGHCPKCLRPARIRIAPGGSTSRIFEAT